MDIRISLPNYTNNRHHNVSRIIHHLIGLPPDWQLVCFMPNSPLFSVFPYVATDAYAKLSPSRRVSHCTNYPASRSSLPASLIAVSQFLSLTHPVNAGVPDPSQTPSSQTACRRCPIGCRALRILCPSTWQLKQPICPFRLCATAAPGAVLCNPQAIGSRQRIV
jgi:hypothetical protein